MNGFNGSGRGESLPLLEDTGTAGRLTVFVAGEQAMLVSTAESQRTWKMMRFRHEFPDLNPDVSIGQIKEMLGMLVGIAPQHQELCLRGVKCWNSQTLEVPYTPRGG